MDTRTINTYIIDITQKEINKIYLWDDEDDAMYEKIINRLIDQNNKEIEDWLWNALSIKEDTYDIDNSSLNAKAKEFVKDYIETKSKWNEMVQIENYDNFQLSVLKSINEPLVGKRIILKPCSCKDNFDLFLNHIENDGDFETYATPDEGILPKHFWINCAIPFAFYINLKDSDEEIGIVNIRDYDGKHSRELKIGEVSYYVYKEHRHKGYAFEAMSLRYRTEECYCKPIALKLNCNTTNSASNALAKKLGFIFIGTNYYYKMMKGIPQHENMYYLDNQHYHKD